MAYKFNHTGDHALYFLTFTCYQWMPLFQITEKYEVVYKWFEALNRKGVHIVAYVIMPNHVHAIVHLEKKNNSLNKLVANGKRFMAYELIEELKRKEQYEVLSKLETGVTLAEKNKGQKHKVFEASFEAKPIYSDHFFHQKLNYIHRNPVSKKWNLVTDYTLYEHSSAAFYELGKQSPFPLKHYSEL